jgi:hypothetical protein
VIVKHALGSDSFCTKRCKKYSGPLLPPGGRNWQLIYPNSSNGREMRYREKALHHFANSSAAAD